MYLKHVLLLCCLQCISSQVEQLQEDTNTIKNTENPLTYDTPAFSEITNQPSIQSRSGYGDGERHGHASYNGGGYGKGDYGPGVGSYNHGGGYDNGGSYDGGYQFDPKRAGYHLGLGLGALKGMLIGKGSEALNHRSGYEYGGGYGGGGYKSDVPALNIYDGLLLLKGIIKGTRESQLDGFYLGKKLAPIQRAFLEKAKAVQGLVSSFAANGGGGYGGGGGGQY
ncbi:hypothetical protein CHUAL_012322 [Chamberlinius hualienensis]